MDHSIETRWSRSDNDGRKECSGRVSTVLTYGDVAWPGERVTKPKEKTTDKVRSSIDLLSALVDSYFFTAGGIDAAKWSAKASKDPTVKGELRVWTDECEMILMEMFSVLDLNGDGVLDEGDLKKMKDVDIDDLALLVREKTHEFMEIYHDIRIAE